ncbi:MAG: hypothetical protein WCR72_11240 [Bacteroidota bacterium]
MESFDIELYKNKAELIRQTVEQVKKDFTMFGVEVEFTANTEMAYAEMFSQLSSQVAHLLEMDPHRLSSLLYQIDLGENKIVESSLLHPEWVLSEVVAELIIHRELKKVMIRNYYKNNPDKL